MKFLNRITEFITKLLAICAVLFGAIVCGSTACLVGGTNVWAESEAEPIQAKGRVMVGLNYVIDTYYSYGGYKYRYGSINVSAVLRASVSIYGKDRVNVILHSSSEKNCGAFMIQLIGLGSSNGTYELSQEQGLNDLPIKVGELIIIGRDLHFKLSQDFITKTTGTEAGICTWTIPQDSSIKLRKKMF